MGRCVRAKTLCLGAGLTNMNSYNLIKMEYKSTYFNLNIDFMIQNVKVYKLHMDISECLQPSNMYNKYVH